MNFEAIPGVEAVAEKTHARLSPSSSSRWLACPGSIAMSEGLVDEGNRYSAEGTCAHELGERALLSRSKRCDQYLGLVLESGGYQFTVDQEMADYVQIYVDYVLDKVGTDGEMFVEVAVPLDHMTGEAEATGTSDVVVVRGREMTVIDLKYGMRVVEAEDNPQALMYASGALTRYGYIYDDIDRVTCVIVQPRKDHISEWSVSVDEVREFEATVREGVKVIKLTKKGEGLNPGEKQCFFCPAKKALICPAHTQAVSAAVFADLDAIDTLTDPANLPVPLVADHPKDISHLLRMANLVEGWVKEVRSLVERTLLTGGKVEGFKLVQGRKGDRKWIDPTEAARQMRDAGIAPYKPADVITPAQLEKQVKKAGMESYAGLITQSDGVPSIAPVSDKRPEIPFDDSVRFAALPETISED